MAEDVNDYFHKGLRIIVGKPCVNGKEDGTIADISNFIEQQFTIGGAPSVLSCKSKLAVDRKTPTQGIAKVKVE